MDLTLVFFRGNTISHSKNNAILLELFLDTNFQWNSLISASLLSTTYKTDRKLFTWNREREIQYTDLSHLLIQKDS